MIEKKFDIGLWLDRGVFAGLCVFCASAPFSITMEEIGAFTALIFFAVKLAAGRAVLKWRWIYLPVAVYFAGLVLSALTSEYGHWRSLRSALQDTYVFLLLPVFIEEGRRIGYDRLLRVLLAASAVSAVYGLLQAVTGIHLFLAHPPAHGKTFYHVVGFFGLHLNYGGFMSMVCIVSVAGLLGAAASRSRIFFGSVSVLTLLAAIVSYSRAALAGLAAGLVFVLLVKIFSGRRIRDFVVPIVLISVIALSVSLIPELRQRVSYVNSWEKLSKDGRFYIWGTAWNAIRHHPLLGIGSGNFRNVFDRYKDPSYLRKSTRTHSHNDLMQSWLDGGLAGLAGYLGIIVLLAGGGVMFFLRSRRKPGRDAGNDETAHLQLGLSSAVVVIFVQGIGQCYMTTAVIAWLFWFLACGLYAAAGSGPAETRIAENK